MQHGASGDVERDGALAGAVADGYTRALTDHAKGINTFKLCELDCDKRRSECKLERTTRGTAVWTRAEAPTSATGF